jgi:[ribosomal protein S18]-alanine N-acetyltransferase
VRRRVFLSRATAADAEALAALAAACHSHPWTAAQISEEIAAGPPGAVLVLRAAGLEGGVVPCASCAYRVVADEMDVLDVAVHPDSRRRGLGRFLVRLALARGHRAGARVARLEVRAGNEPALALYASLGFRRGGLRRQYYREPVEDAVLMERDGLGQDC